MDDKMFSAAIDEAKNKLQKYELDCNEQRNTEIPKYHSAVKMYDDILEKIDGIVFSLDSDLLPRFSKILDEKKENSSVNAASKDVINFDKLLYYVDSVNALNVPNCVRERNPNYCDTVFNTIAVEYLKIKSYLNFKKAEEEKAFQIRLEKIQNEAKRKVQKEWDALCDDVLKQFAQQDSDSEIEKIRQSI